jgi:hypothetical protein
MSLMRVVSHELEVTVGDWAAESGLDARRGETSERPQKESSTWTRLSLERLLDFEHLVSFYAHNTSYSCL